MPAIQPMPHRSKYRPRYVRYFKIHCKETGRVYERVWHGALTPICSDCYGDECEVLSVEAKKYEGKNY